MTILITGAAGFIGHYTVLELLKCGHEVIGVDNLNDYYDPSLKQARLERLATAPGSEHFTFHAVNIADREAMNAALNGQEKNITHIIHLAAQAGVRYSLENPFAYVESNLMGHMVILEIARHLPQLEQLIYASSSSVYGGNTKLPFAVDDRTDHPVSLYAATKKSDELLTHCYSHLYDIPATGLRFFTVYGPWGRPDMAYFSFTKAILEGKPIRVFNHGKLQRDFTYIDDIISGIMGCIDHPIRPSSAAPHRVFNLGNNAPVELMHFIRTLEHALGKDAELIMEDMQPGDVKATYADISASTEELGFTPTTPIEEGLPKFVTWYRDYYNA